jgi:hypothetical protein
MNRLSVPVLTNARVASDDVACFNKRGTGGSIYDSGLVHQISLSNLV